MQVKALKYIDVPETVKQFATVPVDVLIAREVDKLRVKVGAAIRRSLKTDHDIMIRQAVDEQIMNAMAKFLDENPR